MSFPAGDLVYAALQTTFGNAVFVSFVVLGFLMLLGVLAGLSPYAFLLLLIPAIYGFSQSGMLPGWLQGVAIIFLGVILALVFFRLYRD